MGIRKFFRNLNSNVFNNSNSTGRIAPSPWLRNSLDINHVAGVKVDNDTAMSLSAVYSAIRNISEDIAGLPLKPYQSDSDGLKKELRNHRAYKLVHDEPNEFYSSFTFIESLTGQALLYGNGYALIDFRGTKPVSLELLFAPFVEPIRKNDRQFYRVRISETEYIDYADNQILHIRGLGDSISGGNPVKQLKQVIGIALATETYNSIYYEKGTHLGGVVQSDNPISDDAFKRLRESIVNTHEGLANAFKVMFLEEGMKYQSIGANAEDAQLLESRKYNVINVARIFRIPPHMIGDLERATFSNIEQQSLDYVKHTLRPWLIRWEKELNRKLLTDAEKESGIYFEFSVDGFLRGDTAARTQFYRELFNIGAITQNEIRAKENLPPIANGNETFVPLNMLPSSQLSSLPAETDEAETDEAETGRHIGEQQQETRAAKSERTDRAFLIRQRLKSVHGKTISAVIQRLVNKESNAIERKAEQYLPDNPDGFRRWLNDFFSEEKFVNEIKQTMSPALSAYGEAIHSQAADEINADNEITESVNAFISSYVSAYSIRHNNSSKGQIEALESNNIDKAVAAGLIVERLNEWRQNRAEKETQNELNQMGNAVTKQTYKTNGVTKLVWRKQGSETCPICNNLDGKIVGIADNFVESGSELPGGENQAPIKYHRPVGHPPAHKGCDCIIQAVTV